ncbi:ribosomal RNA-processing protein 7 homolog A [Pseudomyrmex gracilis]|uniref:ribosomal RNA-processing protein 7 homolog A n=1 Tax=Pseudomyrmex gracilis TaxID=219809 RepID=UPI000994ED01|nr:ribosomal RNA-processing protein 7 homolog A [Pseudomyrmex gracilis]
MKTPKDKSKDFKMLWIRFDEDSSDKHQLFFKEHSIRNQQPEYPRHKTLFLLNVPPYATNDSLKNAFTELCGQVHFVTFANTKGFKTAYIVFEKESSLNKALELSNTSIITLNNDKNLCLTGIKKWCKEYNDSIYNEKTLKQEIDEYMSVYDKQIEERIAKEKTTEEDEEGWITVTGGKKRGQFAPSRKESTIGKVQQKEEQRKKKNQLLNFYTFQVRESKKQNLAELRKKFEQDKKRLQELKVKRTFKPF